MEMMKKANSGHRRAGSLTGPDRNGPLLGEIEVL